MLEKEIVAGLEMPATQKTIIVKSIKSVVIYKELHRAFPVKRSAVAGKWILQRLKAAYDNHRLLFLRVGKRIEWLTTYSSM